MGKNKKTGNDYQGVLHQIKEVEQKIILGIRKDAEKFDREKTSLPNFD